MKRLWMAAVVAASVWAAPQRVVFEGTQAAYKWELKELDAGLPTDWTGYEFLVVELKASSPQRFWLELHSAGKVQRRQFHPLPNVWIRAAVPLRYYREPNRVGHDLAAVGKVPRNSFWVSTGGVYGPLDGVQAIGVAMQAPHGKPSLEIRSVRLAKEDPGSDVIDKKPVVDEFGQWIPAEWPEKVRGIEALEKAWREEESGLKAGDFGYCKFGGYSNARVKGTGFFRVEQVDGKWWFVDPDGHLFFSTSSTGMRAQSGDSRVKGREDFFVKPPPQGGFYGGNVQRRGTDWSELQVRRMESWGLNTIGNWSDPKLWDAGKKAYVVNLGGWGMDKGFLGLPDVFSEEWPQMVDEAARRQCASRKDDPWLLGYFVANEPPWPGRESLVVDIILKSPPSATQREAKAFLESGDTPEKRKQFLYKAFDRYLEVINAAIKKHDPNHLNLGLRFGGEVPPMEMLRASKAFDVYSMNVYSTGVSHKVMDEVYRVTGRPIIVGEFHFGVPGRGLAAGLVQVKDLAERGVAYRYYVEQAAAHPAFIGSSWFQWVDQPSTGRMDGENYNIGVVDVTDRPYADLVEAMKTTHRRLQAVHAGKTAPFDRKPAAQ